MSLFTFSDQGIHRKDDQGQQSAESHAAALRAEIETLEQHANQLIEEIEGLSGEAAGG